MSGFQNVNNITDKSNISLLEDNIKAFLDWGFLNIGGFIDVSGSIPSQYGGDFSKLVPAKDPALPDGLIWETPRKDWVYENEINHNNRSPINISGIYFNNSFYPAPTGTEVCSYRLNYPLGQVIFNSPKPTSSKLNINHSYRYIQTYKTNNSSWWKEIKNLSYNPAFNNQNINEILTSNHKIQLPAIIIETIARTDQIPYQLGSVDNIISQDLFLHIYAENAIQRNSIIDTLLLQKDRETFLFDVNKVAKSNVYELNKDGSKNINGLNYDQLINNSNYRSKVFYIQNSIISELNTLSNSLYNGIVRWTIKIYP